MPLDSAEPSPAHVREIEVSREIYDSVRVDGKDGACLLRIGKDCDGIFQLKGFLFDVKDQIAGGVRDRELLRDG